MRHVKITFDRDVGVLYALLDGCSALGGCEVPPEHVFILSKDARGNVVGVQILDADRMPLQFWQSHAARNAMPTDLVTELDRWFEHRPS